MKTKTHRDTLRANLLASIKVVEQEVSMEGYCHDCIAVPMDKGYKYATKEECRCSCHKAK